MYHSEWRLGLQGFDLPYAIRKAVFMDELGMAKEEVFDDFDGIAAHLLLWEDETPVATARIYPRETGDLYADQVAVLPNFRKKMYGDLCVRLLLFKAQNTAMRDVIIRVPESSVPYFSLFGFQTAENGEKDGKGLCTMRIHKDDVIWHSACGGNH